MARSKLTQRPLPTEADIVELIPGELALDPEVDARCEERHQLALTHQAAGFYHWIEAGRLHAANKSELGSRKWGPWCRDHKISVDVADMLIRIANRFGPILGSRSEIEPPLPVDFAALRALSSPSAPVAAAKEAVKLAEAGDHITKAEAQRLIVKAREEEAVKAAEEMQAKLAERLAQEATKTTEEIRQHELTLSAKNREIAELKLAAATSAQTERDKHAAELKDKLVVPEDELNATVERLIQPIQAALSKAEKARDQARKQRDEANARLDQLREEQTAAAKAAAAAAGKPRLPPLDSTLQFNSMVTRQHIDACLRELKVTPEEMIRIEIEFSTRLHDNPNLARTKLDQTKATIEKLIPWFDLFLELHRKEYDG